MKKSREKSLIEKIIKEMYKNVGFIGIGDVYEIQKNVKEKGIDGILRNYSYVYSHSRIEIGTKKYNKPYSYFLMDSRTNKEKFEKVKNLSTDIIGKYYLNIDELSWEGKQFVSGLSRDLESIEGVTTVYHTYKSGEMRYIDISFSSGGLERLMTYAGLVLHIWTEDGKRPIEIELYVKRRYFERPFTKGNSNYVYVEDHYAALPKEEIGNIRKILYKR